MADATQVYVFQQFERVPVYHLPSWLVGTEGWRERDDGGEQSLVACGIAAFTWKSGGNSTDHAISLRRDHAELFARLCKRCDALEQAA